MSDTPETDDQPYIYAANDNGYQVIWVDIEFARKLERERNEAITRRMETIMQCELYEQERNEAREALDCLLAVIGLTPIAGNREALQEAVDQGLVVLRKLEAEK